MFERFTDRARRVVVLAQEEARMLSHNHIGTAHLLLGLLNEQSGIAVQALEAAGVTLTAARAAVVEMLGPGAAAPSGPIPFTPRAKKILELSLREALEQGRTYIGTEHLLLGLIREGDGAGVQILERLGEPLPALRQRVQETAKAVRPDPDAQERQEREMWTRDWRRTQAINRGDRDWPPTIMSFRQLLAPINLRLAAIEDRLGIIADETGEEAMAGFRGLVMSLDRHVANIERHLGISAAGEPDEPDEPDDPPTAAD
jgi:ATP-dependent Clp protease ATP-binding subunit ClpA